MVGLCGGWWHVWLWCVVATVATCVHDVTTGAGYLEMAWSGLLAADVCTPLGYFLSSINTENVILLKCQLYNK